MSLNPVDFYNFEELFSTEHKIVIESAREFINKKCLPLIQDSYEKGVFPKNLIKEFASQGFFGINLKGYDCPDLDELTYGLVMKELERCDSAFRSFASVQSSLCMYAIHEFGSEEQKQKFLPNMAKGDCIGCYGLTEADFGSNPAGMKTHAKKDGSDYILNGSKTWITNAPISDVAIVWAKTDEGIRGFLVEKDTKGFESQEIHHKLSLRASLTGSLFFDNVRIPKENLLPKSLGLKSALMCLNQARFGIAFGVLGAAEACLMEALNYSKERIMFQKPLAAYQLVQKKLATMATEITKGNALVLRLAELKQKKTIQPAQISMAKQNNVQIALDCARMARDILGANGISSEYSCMRHMCNLETVYTYEGTNDIHTLIVGQAITGHAAFE